MASAASRSFLTRLTWRMPEPRSFPLIRFVMPRGAQNAALAWIAVNNGLGTGRALTSRSTAMMLTNILKTGAAAAVGLAIAGATAAPAAARTIETRCYGDDC